ncbi:hypothetical protein WR25_15898 isoform B [Diploscapter pachys]|uniref:Putative neurobeachin homolog n=1 Tax=Diploscapter pachys TaxID=2018661 RepID=A0A2A2L8Q7_9BILA|nr:hypothetical protein WR25_15898 isoform B [Diploscapter pachys]
MDEDVRRKMDEMELEHEEQREQELDENGLKRDADGKTSKQEIEETKQVEVDKETDTKQVEESKVDEEIVLDDDIQKDSEDAKLSRIELDDVNADEEETRPEEVKQHEKEELSRISRSSYEREKEEESKMESIPLDTTHEDSSVAENSAERNRSSQSPSGLYSPDGDYRMTSFEPHPELEDNIFRKSADEQPSPHQGSNIIPPPPGKVVETNGNGTDGRDSVKNEAILSLPRIASKSTVIHDTNETPQEAFDRLLKGFKDGSIQRSEVVDQIFNVLVSGQFDLESRFIIEDSTNITRLITFLTHCDESLQSEIWSVFVAIVRKSNRNLDACSRVGLISTILNILPSASPLLSDLLVQLLGVLTTYSITVKETKHFLRSLQAVNNSWPRNSLKLLNVMKEMPRRDGPDVFFSFPGKAHAGIIIPPLAKFPMQQGWTFSTWLRMDPLNSVTFEKEVPFLYSFRSSKGVGYSCHFTGNCLVINAEKTKGKQQSKCIRAELTPRKWHHVAIAHSYSRWGRSDVKCFIDGQLVETVDLNWPVNHTESWDRCAIGCNPDGGADCSFCGQMGAVYLFAETLSLQQANSLFCLGPAYQSTFKHDSESNLPEGYKKHLFDGRLQQSMVMAYCPKNCHGQLCLLSPPKTTASFFVQIPHAVMKERVEVITTHSIHNSLQSVGGIQILLPLFSQLDLPYEDGSAVDVDVCPTLLSLISLLVSSSQTSQQQLFHSKGFLIIAHALQSSSSAHLTMNVVQCIIGMAKFLLRCPAGVPLLKQLFDHILFNPKLWIKSQPEVQVHLYQYLATDFLANNNFPHMLRRVATVLEMCHALKHFYWIARPKSPSTYQVEERSEDFPNQDVVQIRGSILAFIYRLVILNAEESVETNRDDELHALLNFVATVHEDDNLYDVLALLNRLLSEHPAILIPALDRNKALGVVFKLLASPNQLIRIPALKMFGFFLARSTLKRKTDSVYSVNLFSLIAERLLIHTTYLSMPVYNVLFEILVEQMTPNLNYATHQAAKPEWRFENPQMLKVIANLIAQSEHTEELMEVKKAFLLDLINMSRTGRENRRTVLQLSVWQEWLISLSHIFPTSPQQIEICELVYEMFAILLHHAIRVEYGGWRVWVDTLAIAHSKVSWEKFREEQLNRSSPDEEAGGSGANKDERSGSSSADDKPTPIYRTPEFVWSKIHLRLLSDLLMGIENVVDEWRQMDNTTVSDQCGNNENQVFVGNVVHVISQLSDSLIMACGGLLPLLASATSPNSELEISDACQQELPIENAAVLLSRFVQLADTFIFASGVSFGELEQEKNMPSGGVLRQALRICSTAAVRHILAAKVARPDNHGQQFDPEASNKHQSIYMFVKGVLETPLKEGMLDMDRLLQDIDLTRIKGIVYRDMVEESRQAQFLALAVIYLLSVLMVSRYRDILEPPPSPSPFFNSSTNGEEPQAIQNGNTNGDERKSTDENLESKKEEEKTRTEQETGKEDDAAIASINVAPGSIKKDGKDYKAEELAKLSRGRVASQSQNIDLGERRQYLTNKLQTALETSAPLLREIMTDFRSFLQKTLLGTHGQEIMNDTRVMETLKNPNVSVIELVMLLCSQEWQTSLQKHAGLAFIELVNEGRLMAHATRDHVLRVANEADFILNRLRAEDVSKHAQFESETAEQLQCRREEESRFDQLIRSGRRRDSLIAAKLLDKMITILRSPSGAWSTPQGQNAPEMFWRLDVWEDDSRRRKRFVPNAYGSKHEEATLRTEPITEEEEEKLRKIASGIVPTRLQTTELVDESDIDRWAAEIDPPPSSENSSFSTPAKLIAPGLVVPGVLSVTSTDLYFDADEENPLYKQQDSKVLRYCECLHGRWNLMEIRAVFLRRYLLQYTALELFLASRTAIMFAFADQDAVKKVVYQLPRVGVGVKYGLPQSRKTSLMTPRQLFKHSDMSLKWQKREISNFDYLMFLNTVAGRTFNDLNQYPVFPWILSNYTSDTLDLNVASSFRDLSKPIGALSESRRKFFQERYSSWEDESIPAFHYGTHYSTAAFTLNWLMRVEPFASMFIHLQSGKFDHPDRVFHSLADTWEHCQKDTHDVKELIPELFYLPEMFMNSNGFELGKRADGTKVSDVILPKWAKSPEDFVILHRQALESDLVSCQLNQWIDLIFGYKQRGPEAVRAVNVFYYITYEGSVDMKAFENSPAQLEAIQQQIASFGQTPVQLLTEAHPPRHSVMSMAPTMFRRCEDDLCMIMKFISSSPIVYLAANTFQQLNQPSVVSIAQNLVFGINRWDNSYTFGNQQRSVLNMSDKAESEQHQPVELPLTADPLIASGNPTQPTPRRHLGDSFDPRLTIGWNNFVTTTDSLFIFACGYPDYSFRVIDSDSAKVRQVVYGHGDVVSCIARSETSLFADCYIATGSFDCTIALWHWNGHLGFIAGEYNQPGETPSPRAILTGHDAPITALAVSAEHGCVISGCEDGTILLHTTSGDLLRRLEGTGPVTNLLMSRECLLTAIYGHRHIVTYTTTARQLGEVKSEDKLECAALTRDGEYLVTGSDNGRIAIWRPFPLQKLYTYQV